MKPLVLVTGRPGPVLHIWRDRQELARLPLDLHGALSLAADLLAATARAEAGGASESLQACRARTGAFPHAEIFSRFDFAGVRTARFVPAGGGTRKAWAALARTDGDTFLARNRNITERT